MSETNGVERIVKKAGKAYYFSHETIAKIEKRKLVFEDSEGGELQPSYFGAGLHGMNGILKAV